MNWKKEWKAFAVIAAAFLACFYLPVGWPRFDNAVVEALHLVKWYAREHVLLCLVPAFFIAGAIAVFISQASVMKYLGANAPKVLAYGVASVSGTVLAVCSCTVLPLFMGIYRMGAGLGPATAFLYSGPAINVLAIVLTARILGPQMGIARAVGAVAFSVVIGLLMHLIFRKEELDKSKVAASLPEAKADRPLWQNTLYFAAMAAILVFANWGKPEQTTGFWYVMYAWKWTFTGCSAVALGLILVAWFKASWWKMLLTAMAVGASALLVPQAPMLPFAVGVLGLSIIANTNGEELQSWFSGTWSFAKQILPLLLLGVIAAGFLLGRPGGEGVIPSHWIVQLVGGNSLWANLFASVVGAFMYFATLTEVPILQGLIGSGMGQGPALALLLAGPALSLPSMIVLRNILGTKKTAAYVSLVIVMATATGMAYGALAG
ncbi:MAG: permease [Candidatus Hydrogenedentes bacterium]|nr:permease [Candidatus Hydrogenedentota bacterium]